MKITHLLPIADWQVDIIVTQDINDRFDFVTLLFESTVSAAAWKSASFTFISFGLSFSRLLPSITPSLFQSGLKTCLFICSVYSSHHILHVPHLLHWLRGFPEFWVSFLCSSSFLRSFYFSPFFTADLVWRTNVAFCNFWVHWKHLHIVYIISLWCLMRSCLGNNVNKKQC